MLCDCKLYPESARRDASIALEFVEFGEITPKSAYLPPEGGKSAYRGGLYRTPSIDFTGLYMLWKHLIIILDAGLLISNLPSLLVAIIQSTSCGHVSERSQHRRWAVVGSRSASGGLFFSLDCQLVHLSVNFFCNAPIGLRLAHRVVRQDAVLSPRR